MNPTILVIFGATGDVVNKKVIPALYNLFIQNKLPEVFKIVAFARRDFNNGKYGEIIHTSLTTYSSENYNKEMADEFSGIFTYHQGDFSEINSYTTLKDVLDKFDNEGKTCFTKFFYLAIPSDDYELVISKIKESSLNAICKINGECPVNLIIEKPFGLDKSSALKLEQLVQNVFTDEQIFRIDHYLGKEIIKYIRYIKTTDQFKYIWNNKFIKSISISSLEDFGVEDRGNFYDKVGALRDMGQNHLLEILAYIVMSEEEIDTQKTIWQKRAEVIGSLKKYSDDEELKNNTFRAQYLGYRNILNVSPQSETETYFKIRGYLDLNNWSDIPVIMESGKRMGSSRKEILIKFNNSEIHFTFDKVESVIIRFKKDNSKPMEFKLDIAKNNFRYSREYAKLFYEAFNGVKDNFVDQKEVLSSWEFIDIIEEGWKKDIVKLETYKPDTEEIMSIADKKLKVIK